jgi:acyl phosphate:glycerol-3-phosphate acyltransferase
MDTGDLLVGVMLALTSYVAGSIPFGVLIARVTGAPDPRVIGSGRTGGTNALRAMGRRRALAVVTGDVLKGALPVLIARVLTGDPVVEVACGLGAIIGSTHSLFLGFHGGRGVGTSVGTMAVVFPPAILIAAPVFVGIIVVTRFVSLGSLLAIATGALSVVAWWLLADGTVSAAYPAYAIVGAGLIWLAHADNIARLLNGTERRFDLGLLSRDDPAV